MALRDFGPELRELVELLADPRLSLDDKELVAASVGAIVRVTYEVLGHRAAVDTELREHAHRLTSLERERIPLGLV